MRVPDTLLMKLDLNATPPGAVRPQDAGLVLPQGSTPAPLMLILGIVLLLWLARSLLRQRSADRGGALMRALRPHGARPAWRPERRSSRRRCTSRPRPLSRRFCWSGRGRARRAGENGVRPWPWADITPVAVLEVPRLGERSIVLEGASGQAMAFGPGHMINTPPIGARGTAVVAAHRDTQFRYLRT